MPESAISKWCTRANAIEYRNNEASDITRKGGQCDSFDRLKYMRERIFYQPTRGSIHPYMTHTHTWRPRPSERFRRDITQPSTPLTWGWDSLTTRSTLPPCPWPKSQRFWGTRRHWTFMKVNYSEDAGKWWGLTAIPYLSTAFSSSGSRILWFYSHFQFKVDR